MRALGIVPNFNTEIFFCNFHIFILQVQVNTVPRFVPPVMATNNDPVAASTFETIAADTTSVVKPNNKFSAVCVRPKEAMRVLDNHVGKDGGLKLMDEEEDKR